LLLQAENDFDPAGDALMDEFSDALAACLPSGLGCSIELVSVVPIASDA
jgi:hypothetical protein